MSAVAVTSFAVAALAALLVIVALATARGRTEVVDYGGYLARWRALHGVEADQMVGGFVDTYLRLPYAVARPLARRGVSPHVVTLLGLVVALGSLPAYLAGGRWLFLAGFLVLVSGLCDQLDGCVAVLTQRTTTFGAIWDSAVDRLTDVVWLLGPALWLLRLPQSGRVELGLWALVAAGGTLFTLEFVRARCQAVGYVDSQVVTPAERPTRVVVATLAALGEGAAAAFDLRPAVVWPAGAAALAGLTAASVGMLLVDAARRARGDGAIGG